MTRRGILSFVLAAAMLTACSSGKATTEFRSVGVGLHHYVGVAAVSSHGLKQFEAATGINPPLVGIYMSIGTSLHDTDIATVVAQRALPMIQLNPYGVTLQSIAAGRHDRYLRELAEALQGLGRQVVLSFAPEANGTWYSWACNHTSAAVYVSAWQHVHDVIARYDKHITWLWDINQTFPGSCQLGERWPGPSYVTWVGVDGYLRNPGNSFATVLAPTITAVREAYDKPVLIAETGVPDEPQAASWLTSIFAGAEAIPGVIGIVYFNYDTPAHHYRLQEDPPALAVFRREAKKYES